MKRRFIKQRLVLNPKQQLKNFLMVESKTIKIYAEKPKEEPTTKIIVGGK
jgi:hypothetical protein